MNYYSFGHGNKTMVIIPGLALNPTLNAGKIIEELFSSFKDDFTVYLIDERSCIKEGDSLDTFAEEYAREMNELGIRDAYIFGASMGGMIGLLLSIRHPELVKKLFLGSVISRPNEMSAKVFSRWLSYAEKGQVQELVESSLKDICSPAYLERYWDNLVCGVQNLSEEELFQYRVMLNAIIGFNCYGELEAIKAEVMAVGAKGDQTLSWIGTQEIADKIGITPFFYGEEYGHNVYDEAPDYREKIYEFFIKQIKN